MNWSNHSSVRFCARSHSRPKGSRRCAQPFRKTCRPGFHSHICQYQGSSRSAQTCFEGPFGEVVRSTGPMAKANPFQFSTKYKDDEADLIYYGYRFYNRSTGRWASRDPLDERGGQNVYGFLLNDPISFVDTDGRALGFFGGAYNWFVGRGNVHVPFSQYDPGWGASDFPGFAELISRVCSQCPGRFKTPTLTRTADLYAQGRRTILLKGGPGRYAVQLDGFIASFKDSCPCRWRFRGDVTIPPDRFNFDDPLSPGRTGPGRLITTGVWVFQHTTGIGHDFWIYFDGSRFVDVSGDCPMTFWQGFGQLMVGPQIW